MRKFLIRAIPIVTIIVFITIMLSDNYLKHSFSDDDDVPKYIQTLLNDVEYNRWDDAYNSLTALNKAWIKVVKRIQFSAERNEINNFDNCIARLHGAISAKDKVSATLELSEAYGYWVNIGK